MNNTLFIFLLGTFLIVILSFVAFLIRHPRPKSVAEQLRLQQEKLKAVNAAIVARKPKSSVSLASIDDSGLVNLYRAQGSLLEKIAQLEALETKAKSS